MWRGPKVHKKQSDLSTAPARDHEPMSSLLTKDLGSDTSEQQMERKLDKLLTMSDLTAHPPLPLHLPTLEPAAVNDGGDGCGCLGVRPLPPVSDTDTPSFIATIALEIK